MKNNPLRKTIPGHAIKSPACELKQACQQIGRTKLSANLFARNPSLKTACARLTSLLTIYWPNPDQYEESLLLDCLRNAFESINSGTVLTYEEEHQLFVQSIVSELGKALLLTPMIKHGTYRSIHHACTDPYLDEIARGKDRINIEWTPTEAIINEKTKLIIASKVFSVTELEYAGFLE